MPDTLDLNSVIKARLINLQFIITAHIKLQEFSNNFLLLLRIYYAFFCVAV